jgi:hypothetical protein
MLKITALKDVWIYANVVSHKSVASGESDRGIKPVNTDALVKMRAGEIHSNISLFLGIDPKFLPHEESLQLYGFDFVPYRSGQNSPAFQALVRVEEVKR